MLEDGLSYPVRGDWLGRTLIGGVLGLLSVFVIPTVVVLGYLVRVLETTVEGADEPPAFEDWTALLVRGVVASVIVIAYTLVPVLAYLVVLAVFFGAGGIIGGDVGALVGVAGVLAALGLIPVVLVVYYAVPAALTAYATQGSIGAAFDVSVLRPVVLRSEYLIAVLAPLVVAVLLWIVTAVLAVTIVGLLLVPFVQFYGQVAVFRMFGAAFATARGSPGTRRAV